MLSPFIARAAGIVLAAGLLTAPLGGCGRRGDLEPAPDPSVAAADAPDASPQSGLKRPKRVPITPPHDAFFLDPLL